MYKALIVDDEKPVRQIITALGRWRSFGIDPPFYACDGQSALLSMRELHPEIVFLDITASHERRKTVIELASKAAGTPSGATATVEEELAEADKELAEEDPDLALLDE